MKIKPFGVEEWMNQYENDALYNLGETCVKSLTVKELLNFQGRGKEALEEIYDMQLTYGAIPGTDKLREGVAGLYESGNIANVVIAHGGIGANHLVFSALVEPGDEVISVMPTYQQHYSIPESLGATVKILPLTLENGFLPDIGALKKMANENTKLIAINNPNNPTGSLMDKASLEEIVEIAKAHDSYILSDEVYRGLNHQGAAFGPSIFDLYEKGISTGSMSKVFSLAGLRIGWIMAGKETVREINIHRDYNTISCGKIDDYLAGIALEVKDKILKRNRSLILENAKILEEWVKREPRITYQKPAAGTTALIQYDYKIKSRDLASSLLRETGAFVVPGEALEQEGYLRIGYANDSKTVKEGLDKISGYFRILEKEGK
ncbi:aminotransferase [Isachenkonia alkalipeptolytica]|uniref:Aminotransferase n=1 Tax=Isachenkonia alkalipeptolytica TaxID=2565777 RepID=A0AA44BDN7_9CLOT|nr:aminotransferase [Isachenkonia alkalipeptolytica]NBG88093.1 aminotransferase [Isachenkonia alkalipeptolytica]